MGLAGDQPVQKRYCHRLAGCIDGVYLLRWSPLYVGGEHSADLPPTCILRSELSNVFEAVDECSDGLLHDAEVIIILILWTASDS